MAVIKAMVRSNMCINAHPVGCAKETQRQIDWVKAKKTERGIKNVAEGGYAPKTVVVLGCSTGYGLASRIAAAFEFGADTIGISFEKVATSTKVGTPGWYNNKAFDEAAAGDGLRAATFNADAYSDESRQTVIRQLKDWEAKADLVLYSLASPVRTDPDTKIMYKSVIKPIGQIYSGDSIDIMSGKITQASTNPAEAGEIASTVKVMGGEDWERWIRQLLDAGVLAEGCRTLAYSYIGPKLSHPVYRDGTIGEAKKDLEARAKNIDSMLRAVGGAAYISVNKGLITRSSSVIPIITEYLGVLFKVMKKLGKHEGCIEQMERLFTERLYTADRVVPLDAECRIRMDDWEMSDEVQAEVEKIMPTVTEENLEETVDLAGIRHDFLAINGFDIDSVDYNRDIADMSAIH